MLVSCMDKNKVSYLTELIMSLNKCGKFGEVAVNIAAKQYAEMEKHSVIFSEKADSEVFSSERQKIIYNFILALNEGGMAVSDGNIDCAIIQYELLKKEL